MAVHHLTPPCCLPCCSLLSAVLPPLAVSLLSAVFPCCLPCCLPFLPCCPAAFPSAESPLIQQANDSTPPPLHIPPAAVAASSSPCAPCLCRSFKAAVQLFWIAGQRLNPTTSPAASSAASSAPATAAPASAATSSPTPTITPPSLHPEPLVSHLLHCWGVSRRGKGAAARRAREMVAWEQAHVPHCSRLPLLPSPFVPWDLLASLLNLAKQAASLPSTATPSASTAAATTAAANAPTNTSPLPSASLPASLHSSLALLVSLLLSELVPCHVSCSALSLLLLEDSPLPSSAAAAKSSGQQEQQQNREQQQQGQEGQLSAEDSIRELSTQQLQILSTCLRHMLTSSLPTNQQQQLNLTPRRTTLPSPSSSPSFLLSPLLPPPVSSKQQGSELQVWQQGKREQLGTGHLQQGEEEGEEERAEEQIRGGGRQWSQVQRVQEGLRRMQQELQQRLALSAMVTAALCHGEGRGNETERAGRNHAAGGGKAAGRGAAAGRGTATEPSTTEGGRNKAAGGEAAGREAAGGESAAGANEAVRGCMERAAVNWCHWVLSHTTHTATTAAAAATTAAAAAAAAAAGGDDAGSVGLNTGTQEQTRATGATVLVHPLLTTCALTFAHRSGLTTPATIPSLPHTSLCTITLKPINATQTVWHCLSCSRRISTEGMLCLDACRPFFLPSGRQNFWVRAEAWAERLKEASGISAEAAAEPEEEVTAAATVTTTMPVCPYCAVQAVAPTPRALLSLSLV
ncbi:unnamed protein product [Closterium sp. Naga37s-1]|nr:unnamed protein product [Closterium sp. Naga37s-1]